MVKYIRKYKTDKEMKSVKEKSKRRSLTPKRKFQRKGKYAKIIKKKRKYK